MIRANGLSLDKFGQRCLWLEGLRVMRPWLAFGRNAPFSGGVHFSARFSLVLTENL